jgi:hypothetical protein
MSITGQTRCDSDTSVENTMRKPFAIAVLTLLASTAFAAGEVYRWKDAGGVWHYSDQPHPGAEVVRGQAASSAPAAAPAATPAPAAAAAAPTTNEPLPVSKEVAQEVRQEAATAKAKLCEKAKVDYKNLVENPRVRTVDEKGNTTVLDAAAMDKARLNARAVRDLACGP